MDAKIKLFNIIVLYIFFNHYYIKNFDDTFYLVILTMHNFLRWLYFIIFIYPFPPINLWLISVYANLVGFELLMDLMHELNISILPEYIMRANRYMSWSLKFPPDLIIKLNMELRLRAPVEL